MSQGERLAVLAAHPAKSVKSPRRTSYLLKMLRAVFFDLGGTLLQSKRERTLEAILERGGVYVPLARIEAAYQRADTWWEQIYGDKTLRGEELNKAFADLDRFLLEQLDLTRDFNLGEYLANFIPRVWDEVDRSLPYELYEDAMHCLQVLRSQGLRLALISNAPPSAQQIAERLGLNRYLNPMVISGIVGVAKPDPAIFQIALTGTGVSAEKAVHIGDSYKTDILGARSAGLRPVLLDRAERYPDADCPRIRSLGELERLLMELFE